VTVAKNKTDQCALFRVPLKVPLVMGGTTPITMLYTSIRLPRS
jgi:hypothetical protein